MRINWSLFLTVALLSALVSFFAVPQQIHARIVSESNNKWTLRPPTQANSDLREGPYRVDEVRSDANGGFARVTFFGTEGCQGQSESIKYTWRFDHDISVLSGRQGDRVLSVNMKVEGGKNACMNLKPFMAAVSNGVLLGRDIRGEARWFREADAESPPNPVFSLDATNRTEEGLRIDIWLPCPGGCAVRVDYTYDGSAGPAGGDTGGTTGGDETTGGTTTTSGGGPTTGENAACAQYARRAVEQNAENIRRGCGYTGVRWHDSYDSHYGWCLDADPAARDSETTGRDEQLRHCGPTGGTTGTGEDAGGGTESGTGVGSGGGISTLPTPPFGSPEPNTEVSCMTLQAGQRHVEEGATVTVPVWLIKATNLANMNFELRYNAGVARTEGSVSRGSLMENTMLSSNAGVSGVARVGFARTRGLSGTGSVVNIPFKAVGKPGDRTPLTLTLTTVNDPSGHVPSVCLINGEIAIVGKAAVGECDGDGRLTESDALCALEMSVNLRPVNLAVDMDGDGNVTSRDAVLILQKAVGLIR